ncbi:MAG: sulfonate transport system substrate-binding protein [Paraburkholderia sp.]|jgi:NitT/TauT family transport system substrate-binding protein|nr:sulfonate transport system substrate-binding protein [Paraburkholderia sp.]
MKLNVCRVMRRGIHELLRSGLTSLAALAGLRGKREALAASLALLLLGSVPAQARTTLVIGIGTQDTTTNTVTGGAVIRELKLLDKYLPHDGKYKDIDYKIDWQNFTSGPPVTNGMIAGKLQIGMMGDYPLLVNGATGQQLKGNETELIAVLAYNAFGAGNGVVVNTASPYYSLADLKGKLVSVPFGSAAHGMLLKAMREHGWPSDYFQIANQSPEVGTTNLQERKIDAHADFVPFPELLPYRGFARKVYDGVETKTPTFHGVVVRKDFADQYPEVVVAYLRALLEANAWVRAQPQQAAEKVEQWTHINKEVAYIFLGPNGIHTLDPTIKPIEIDALKSALDTLKSMNRVKDFNIAAWVNDSYLRTAFKQANLDYGAQQKSLDNYSVTGTDSECRKPIDKPQSSAQVWLQDGSILPFSSAGCAMLQIVDVTKRNQKIDVVYVMDHSLGIKLFADKAFYVVSPGAPGSVPDVTPFLLKSDAQRYASQHNAQVEQYEQVVAQIGAGK